MTAEQVIEQLIPLFRQHLGQPELNLTSATTAADVEGWDSLMHIQLMMAVEAEFGVAFTTEELVAYDSVGALAAAVASKVS